MPPGLKVRRRLSVGNADTDTGRAEMGMKNTISMGERVNATISRIKKVIYGRTVMILLGFLAQLILLGVGYILLRNYSFLFYIFFLSIGAVAVVYIFNAPGNPDLKL